ncbi:DNA polymerase III subunit delta' [Thiohalorhabdus sp.]|uniref:DNA polymerase III subunit delta' n=1 Tax=Thiohalorhabdus sp. TaxID=3094134 RepID=UPI002FC287BB
MSEWGLIGQEGAIGLLERALGRNQVPQGLLLAGLKGSGKHTAARRVANRLLCVQGPASEPCGACGPCRRFAAGTAPDYTEVTVGPGEEIRIDQVREVNRQSSLTPQESGRRVILMDPAEALNAYAANALLKLLEEPPGVVHFLLISHRPDRLPATIRSRCQTAGFHPVAAGKVAAWLTEHCGHPSGQAELAARLSAGAPGWARALADRDLVGEREAVVEGLAAARTAGGESVLEVAAGWADADPATWLPHLLAWLRDMARVRVLSGQAGGPFLANPDREKALRGQASERDFTALDSLLRAADELADAVHGPLSTRLAVEEFLLTWRRA